MKQEVKPVRCATGWQAAATSGSGLVALRDRKMPVKTGSSILGFGVAIMVSQ